LHAGELGQVINFRPTIVGGTAKLNALHQSVHGFVLLLFARGRHCYAGQATC